MALDNMAIIVVRPGRLAVSERFLKGAFYIFFRAADDDERQAFKLGGGGGMGEQTRFN